MAPNSLREIPGRMVPMIQWIIGDESYETIELPDLFFVGFSG